ncbi:MAG: hypothetical protein GWM98_03680, partial [Nitrospinaceae bacterium]|nr:hypothetical protein [Nitrospinaceae bacterium]NIR53769.1 hypothetical protein [Nitrospinaceae bacterium]NIS84179.1 hypothetical protein [Nitrospinaceae bacterium]NIT80985.1 hypothetical protein [Nitrospinaceae bacterium]NIU43275.1 hypothetical protein [Nitrospinaceae bacterium]
TFLLKEENRFQSFDLPPRTTRHVMVRVESNRGGVYAQLGEIRIWAEPREKSEAKKPEPVKKKKSVDTSPPTANP